MSKNSIKWLVAVFAILALTALMLQGTISVSGSRPGSFDSPVMTPVIPGPTPTPFMSQETQRALEHIAARESIPVEQLVAVNQHQREYKLLGKTFWSVIAQDLKGDRWYSVMVNLADGSFVDNIETIEQAEREAHLAKYGKLEPALFDRLETMKPNDKVMVAIWIAGNPKRSREELFAALAARHPEAQAALERSGKPFDVGDPQLANALEAEYVKMLEEDTLTRVQFLKDALQAQGYTVTTFGAMPAIAAILPKALILEIASRPDVGVIYLIEEPVKPELNSAVPTDRVPTVWQRGFKGSGIDIAILEPGKVDFTGPAGHNYLHQGQVRPCSGAEDQHKTLVASAAASYHGTYTGVAPEATVHDACTDSSEADTVAGLSWATGRADPINFSAGLDASGQLHFLDKAFDYWAFQGNDTVVKSAGQDGEYITAPGNGWNVIAVGGSDDKGNADWSDDVWWSSSRWKNPVGTDREKPEVVAPAKSITGIELNNATATADGTSFAAPQVAGVVALLMNRNPDLTSWPEAVRAIVMASAVHNIEGPSGIPTGQDLKDGAGGIDAALADRTATTRWYSSTDPCTGPCWWGFGIDNTNFPVGAYLYRYFNTSRGERVRVAVAWWSKADCASMSSCNYDRLDTDLHMGAQYFDGSNWVWIPGAWSASYDNNYELVEFTAPHTGQYRIAVYKTRADETSNYLGIAWVKDATYLPDLANEAVVSLHPWVSEIYIRNEAPLAQSVAIYYHENEGIPTPKGSDLCYLAPNQWCAIPMDEAVNGLYRIRPGQRGSATVQGGEDVTVLVLNTHQAAPYAADSYTGIAQTSAALRAPLIYRNNSSWQTDFTIYNPNSQADNFQVVYDAWSGAGCTTGWLSLPANGNYNLNQLGWPNCSLSPTFIGGARITSQSQRPLAGVAFQWNWVNSTQVSRMSYELFATGASPAYAPLVMRNNSGYYTGIGFQDTSGNAENLTLHYYQQDGSLCGTNPYYVGANGAYPVNPAPPNGICVPTGSLYIGGARATRGANLAFAGVVNQVRSGANTAMSYDMPPSGARTVIVPLVMRDRDNWRGKNDWITGFAIQNTAGSAAAVTIQYYAQGGQLAGASTFSVAAYGVAIVNPAPGNLSPFLGSAVIVADQPVAVMVDYASTGPDDHGMSVAGVNR